MAKVIITALLEDEINKVFKKESIEVFSLLRTLGENPYKGRELGVVGRVLDKADENSRTYLLSIDSFTKT